MRRALLSVSDKRGIVDFARGLADARRSSSISTGGTAARCGRRADVRAIDDFTGFPEIMDGRVKTLHPKLYAGLLAPRDDPEHLRQAAEQGIEFVDLVVREPLPVRAHERAAGRQRRGGDREHRHRRPDDDPRGGEELPVRRRRRHARELRRRPDRAAGVRRPALAGDARVAGRRGVRLHRALRHGDLPLVRRARRRVPRPVHARVREGHRPPVRREPAPARGVLLAGRRAHARAVDGQASTRASRCRSTTCSTSTPRAAWPASSRCRRARSSSTTTRAGRRSAAPRWRPTSARSPATRSARSAASSRSTAASTARPPRRSPSSSSRSSSRPPTTTTRSKSSPRSPTRASSRTTSAARCRSPTPSSSR